MRIEIPQIDQRMHLDKKVDFLKVNREMDEDIIFDSIYIKKSNDALIICITLYNEPEKALLLSLYSVVKAIEAIYDKIGCFNRVTVTIIADGLDKISDSVIDLLNKLKITQNRQDYSRFGVSIYDNDISIRSVIDYYTELSERGDIGTKWISLSDNSNTKKEYNSLFRYDFRTLLVVKEENKGKLNSHWWFFKIFCKKLNPVYCFQLDAGTAIDSESLYLFWKYMEQHKNVGASASRVQVPSSKNRLNVLKFWQFGDFATQKLIDWPAEIFSGYLSVIPGQFCVFRWAAISSTKGNTDEKNENSKTPLDYYFRGLSDLGPFESNMFLAEDRILGYEIISRKNSSWQLAYVPEVLAITDPCDTLTELFHQRRRWINSSFACNLWLIFKIFNYLSVSRASLMQKAHTLFAVPWLIINCMIQWVFPSLMLILIESLLYNTTGSVTSFPPYIKDLLFPVFSVLMILQVYMFYTKKLSEKTEKLIVVTSFIQVSIVVLSLIYYLENQSFSLISLNLITILLLETCCLLLLSIMVSINLFRNFLKNIIPYMIVRPFMLMLLTIYSFCNVHDCSWGTKGLNNYFSDLNNYDLRNKKLMQFKYFRLSTFVLWTSTNTFIIIYILLQSPIEKQSLLEFLLYFFIIFTSFKIISGILFTANSIYKKLNINIYGL